MKTGPLALATVLLGACATTYNMPLEERTRSFRASSEVVWDAALASVDDADLSLVEAEVEHGRIRARSASSVWDLKGHLVMIVVRDLGDGWVRVDANAQTSTEDRVVDFGASERIVHRYLAALERRMGSVPG